MMEKKYVWILIGLYIGDRKIGSDLKTIFFLQHMRKVYGKSISHAHDNVCVCMKKFLVVCQNVLK